MRRPRDPDGLGAPVESGLPVIPERVRTGVLVAVCALCVAIFLGGIVVGLSGR